MTAESMLASLALRNWKLNTDRADKIFGGQSEEQLQREVAPGRNRLIYIWGHVTAVNDALLPLLGFGPRLHPELDDMFIKNADRSHETILSGAEVKSRWTEINDILWMRFEALTPTQWLEKHAAVSEEAFAREPHRNRFNVVLGRTAHLAEHLGQAILAEPRK